MVVERHAGSDETDVEAVLQQWDEDQARKGRFNPKQPGEFTIRILPPRERGKFFVPFGMHYNLDLISPAFGEDHRTCACPKLTLRDMDDARDPECLICKTVNQLYFDARNPDGSRNQALVNKAGELRVRKRFVANVLNEDNPGAGVLTWEYGPTVQDMVIPLFKEWRDITSPTEGRSLRVKFEKKGDYLTAVSVMPKAKPTEITIAGWREQRKDLTAYATATLIQREKLAALISGGSYVASRAAAAVQQAEDVGVVAGDGEVAGVPAEAIEEGEATVTAQPAMRREDYLNDPKVKEIIAQIDAARNRARSVSGS